MRSDTPLVVHVALDAFFSGQAGREKLEALLARAEEVKRCLERHGESWERPTADEAVLITRASGRPPGWAIGWGERVREEIRTATSLEVSIGIASTRLAARLASRLARPRGLVLLLPGYETSFVSGLPLEEVDELGSSQIAALRRRGVKTLGELAGLASDEVWRLAGPEGLAILRQLRSEERPAPASYAGRRLERAIRLLCRRAARKLVRRRLSARGVELRFWYRDSVSVERYALLPSPACGGAAAWEVARLEEVARNLLRSFPAREEELIALSLTVTGLAPPPGQLALLAGALGGREIEVRLGRLPV